MEGQRQPGSARTNTYDSGLHALDEGSSRSSSGALPLQQQLEGADTDLRSALSNERKAFACCTDTCVWSRLQTEELLIRNCDDPGGESWGHP